MTRHTIRDALQEGAALLRQAGIEPARLEARLLLAHSLGVTPSTLLRDLAAPVDTTAYAGLVDRRARHEPLAFILGHREFWSLDFAVSPNTLIPRADSETLIEAAIAVFADRVPPRRVLDLGTGTGCLLLAALSEFRDAFGVGVDRSPAAAALARRNAAMLEMAGRSAFLCGDWAASLQGSFDLIVANPPYIATPDLAALMPEVAGHEPQAALDGGPDGYAAYRRLIPDFRRLLAADGIAILEIGQGQSDIVGALARNAGFHTVLRGDLNGIARAAVLRARLP